jgi:hypothetical protein
MEDDDPIPVIRFVSSTLLPVSIINLEPIGKPAVLDTWIEVSPACASAVKVITCVAGGLGDGTDAADEVDGGDGGAYGRNVVVLIDVVVVRDSELILREVKLRDMLVTLGFQYGFVAWHHVPLQEPSQLVWLIEQFPPSVLLLELHQGREKFDGQPHVAM